MKAAMAWVTILCVCAGFGGARADDYEWIGGSGDWSDLAHWQLSGGGVPSALPGAGDSVIFHYTNPDVDVTVTVDVDPAVANFTVSGGTRWHFNQDADGATVTVTGTVECADVGYMSNFNPALVGAGVLDFHSTTPHSMAFNNSSNTYAGGTTVRSGLLAMNSIGPGSVTVAGGELVQIADWNQDLTMAGGRYGVGTRWPWEVSGTNDGEVILQADATLTSGSNFDRSWALNGVISGPHKLTYDALGGGVSGGGTKLVLTNVNTFSGGLEVISGRIYATADGALGTGTVHVRAGESNAGGLALFADQVTSPPLVVAEPGGWVSLQDTSADMTFPLALNGGTLMGTNIHWDDGGGNTAHNSSEPIALTADSFLGTGEAGGSLTVKSKIVEEGGSFSLTRNLGSALVILDNAENDYSGGTAVLLGSLRSNVEGALGSGPVVVGDAAGPPIYWGYPLYRYGATRLETGGDNSLDGVGTVTVHGESTLRIGGTELGDTDSPTITVKAGAALSVTGGATDLIYSGPDTNVELERGAILYGVADAPTYDEVTALAGGSGFGVYLAAGGTHAGTYTNDGGNPFGDGGAGSTNIYRGLAAADGQTLTFTGTAEEVTGGTDGVALYAQVGSTFRIGDIGVGCTINADKLTLGGYGAFEHWSNLNVLPDTIEMNGKWELTIYDPGSIGSTQTIEANDGLVAFGIEDVLQSGATLNVNAGAVFKSDLYVSTGAVNIKAGGAEYVTDEYNFSPRVSREPGALICLGDTFLDSTPPGGGVVTYLIGNHTDFGGGGLQLGDDTRLTLWANRDGGPKHTGHPEVQGLVVLAPGAGGGRLCAPSESASLRVRADVDFGAGTLIVGDPNPIQVPKEQRDSDRLAPRNHVYGWTPLSQDGVVWLDNASGNVFGAIDVQAGTLRGDSAGAFGGAAEIRVRDGATLWYQNHMTLSAVISGEGTLLGQANGSRRLTVEPDEGVDAGLIAGEDGSGVLNVTGHVTFAAYTGTTPANPSLSVAVVGSGTVPDADFGQVAVTGNVNGVGDLAVEVSLPVPSVALDPADFVDIPVVTANSIGTGTAVASVATGETIGEPGDTHWEIRLPAGRDAAVEVVGSELILHGDCVAWTALNGDANLDGQVGIADLSALADNYGLTTGANWKRGDFNLDGIVGIADLSALADNYGNTEGGIVPEPAGLAILTLGAAVLIRRKRR